jgi:IclR family acetate operon transcriptional repressor
VRAGHTTITDPDRLLAELEQIRARGYVTNNGEWRADVGWVAAAVMGSAEEPIASLSVNIPISRLTDESQSFYGIEVSGAARALTSHLGYPPDSAPHASS